MGIILCFNFTPRSSVLSNTREQASSDKGNVFWVYAQEMHFVCYMQTLLDSTLRGRFWVLKDVAQFSQLLTDVSEDRVASIFNIENLARHWKKLYRYKGGREGMWHRVVWKIFDDFPGPPSRYIVTSLFIFVLLFCSKERGSSFVLNGGK
jgi:hypothetical protein